MSENSQDIVKCVARVWRLNKKQEALFRGIMGREISANLRRACSNGYMISILNKKEIGNLYEALKCNLNDGDLASITRSITDQEMKEEDPIKLLAELVEEQNRLKRAYEALIPYLDEGSEAAYACQRHVEELCEIQYTLVEELSSTSPDTALEYPSVA
jgi:hypothetical protein